MTDALIKHIENCLSVYVCVDKSRAKCWIVGSDIVVTYYELSGVYTITDSLFDESKMFSSADILSALRSLLIEHKEFIDNLQNETSKALDLLTYGE